MRSVDPQGDDGRPIGDLLRPSLTEADDAVGFHRPWNPIALVFVAFLGGMPAGGLLLADNCRRLGLRDRIALTVAVSVIVTLLVSGGLAYAHTAIPSHAAGDSSRRLCRFIAQACVVAAAYPLCLLQQKRYRLFQHSGGEPGRVIIPAVGAIVLGIVVNIALLQAATRLVRAMGG